MDLCEEVVKKNLGKSACNALPGLWATGIWTPKDFRLAPADYVDEAALKTALQDLLLLPYNQRGYLFPEFVEVEDNSEEAQYQQTQLRRIPIRDGAYRFKPYVSQDLCTHVALFSHRSLNTGRFIPLDVNGKLFLTDPLGDGNLAGFTLSLLWTEKLRLSNGGNATVSPLLIDLKDNEEIDLRGVMIDGSVVNELERLTDIDITLTVGDAFNNDEFYVEVKQSCDGVAVSGLLLADFKMFAADGITPQVIDSVTEDTANNNPGRYLIDSGAGVFANGNLTLRAPSALTVKAYEVANDLAIIGIV